MRLKLEVELTGWHEDDRWHGDELSQCRDWLVPSTRKASNAGRVTKFNHIKYINAPWGWHAMDPFGGILGAGTVEDEAVARDNVNAALSKYVAEHGGEA